MYQKILRRTLYACQRGSKDNDGANEVKTQTKYNDSGRLFLKGGKGQSQQRESACHHGKKTAVTAYLAVFEVIDQDVHALALNTVLLDDDARASNHLARISLAVDLAKPSPRAENLGVADFDQVDVVVGAQRFDELGVLRLRAGIDEDAEVRLALVECLCALPQATRKPVMYQCIFKHLLRRGSAGHISQPGLSTP